MSRAPSPLISPPHKACATRRWVLFLHYAFIIWPIDSHSCHYLALHRSILQLDHHKIALLVQKRQASSGSQRQPIPKSLRAGGGERRGFDDQNNIVLLPSQDGWKQTVLLHCTSHFRDSHEWCGWSSKGWGDIQSHPSGERSIGVILTVRTSSFGCHRYKNKIEFSLVTE